jgi:DNA ligase (NAD+)
MVKELVELIKNANEQYRLGTPIMSDIEYDSLISELEMLDSDNEILKKIGLKVSDDRKSRLPIIMASMNKEKSIEDVVKWARLKQIDLNESVIITPKYDGLSLCVDETTGDCWTRGDGVFGQKSNEHYKLVTNKLKEPYFKYTYGEIIMKRDIFIEKYRNDFANPRNLVAGLMNSKTIQNSLSDCFYIKYGGISNKEFKTKREILNELNQRQSVKVPFVVKKISELNDQYMESLFREWSEEFEIDGLIIEINSIKKQLEIGRDETTNNPKFALAFKSPSFEQTIETEILEIDWNISKNGSLKPIARLAPVKLDGVTISNVTCNNARFVKDNGLGKGAIVRIVRSGMVIPKIIDVVKSVEFKLPPIENIGWSENRVELVTIGETDQQKLKKNIAFFEILGTDGVSEGVIAQLWDAGYRTIKDILSLNREDLEKINRFGKKKAKIVYDSIQKSVTGVSLSKLQHATGIFKGLGSLKLEKLEHFKTKPTINDVMSIEGFAEISAKSYVESYDDFFDFIKDLPITIGKSSENKPKSSQLEGMVFVYTGIRDKESEEIIISKGGRIASSVSKNVTHLVCKDPNSGSSKLEKAKSLGIKIISILELNNMLSA